MQRRIIFGTSSPIRKKIIRSFFQKCDFISHQCLERKEELSFQRDIGSISYFLALKKALSISKDHCDRYVVSFDQVLIHRGCVFHKVKSRNEAIERLLLLQGEEHLLNSAICFMRNKEVIWKHNSSCLMKMKMLSISDIESYIDSEENVYQSAGCYLFEKGGSKLFQSFQGDPFSILGVDIFSLKKFLTNNFPFMV